MLCAHFRAGVHTFLRFSFVGDTWSIRALGIVSSSICIAPHVKVWRQFSDVYIRDQNLKSENRTPESEKENSETGTKISVNERAIIIDAIFKSESENRKSATEKDDSETETV